jgi:hypothetical protein
LSPTLVCTPEAACRRRPDGAQRPPAPTRTRWPFGDRSEERRSPGRICAVVRREVPEEAGKTGWRVQGERGVRVVVAVSARKASSSRRRRRRPCLASQARMRRNHSLTSFRPSEDRPSSALPGRPAQTHAQLDDYREGGARDAPSLAAGRARGHNELLASEHHPPASQDRFRSSFEFSLPGHGARD